MTKRTRVKICGITNVEDALIVTRAGADAIGLVFYPDSPRYVTIEDAKNIVNHLSPFISCVGLFVDADQNFINDVLSQVKIDTLQFHGHENEQACALYDKPYIKALRVGEDFNVLEEIEKFPSAQGVLLDTYVKDKPGGTGQLFDWDKIPSENNRKKPVILAGGLTPENVKQAIQQVKPYAVDVSGGVELDKGKKDPVKVDNFIYEAINA